MFCAFDGLVGLLETFISIKEPAYLLVWIAWLNSIVDNYRENNNIIYKVIMKNSHYINGWLFQTKLFGLSILLTASNSFSEETNLKINILSLNKPGVLYLSVCQDKESFERTVYESEEKICIRASKEMILKMLKQP